MTSHSKMIQGSPEWHAWRMGGLGASEVAAVIGVCPYNTPTDIWLVKTGRKKGFEGNSFTEHGKETEGKARARYELKHMEDMTDAIVVHPAFPICRASLDGVRADGKLILEIKCPVGHSTIDAAKAGKVPDHYWPQVQWQLAASGADECHFFVFHEASGEDALVIVKSDVSYQGKIIAECQAWWDKYVVANVPPPLTERDVKEIAGEEIEVICDLIKTSRDSMSKSELDKLKAKAVAIAAHPKMRCGSVQISTVLRNGKFSYHKLTIQKEGA